MKKAIIFDLDGTLVNTLDSLHASVNYTLEQLKLDTISKNQCREFIGNGIKVLVEKSIESSNPKANIEFAMKLFNEYYNKNCTKDIQVYDGIFELVKILKKYDYLLFVLTNKNHYYANIIIDQIFPSDTFCKVQGYIDSQIRKPDPKSILNLIHQFDLKVENCIFIGDSQVDIQTGKGANIKTIGVTWGYRSQVDLENAKADIIVSKPLEIIEKL